MKKYNVLCIVAFVISICSIAMPLAVISIPILIAIRRHIQLVSKQNQMFIKASIIMSSFSLFVWSFSIGMTLFHYTEISETVGGVLSFALAGILTIIGVWFYIVPPSVNRKKQKNIYAVCSGKQKDGAWTVYEYEVAPYGYDFMLRISQLFINYAYRVEKATTAELVGMPEVDRIRELCENENVISSCDGFANETGVVILGALISEPELEKGYPIQMSLYNQTNKIRLHVAGVDERSDFDSFINTLVREAST